MAVNKVVYGSNTLIDLTSDTISADKLVKGITAHSKSGETITGMLSAYVDGTTFIFPEGITLISG